MLPDTHCRNLALRRGTEYHPGLTNDAFSVERIARLKGFFKMQHPGGLVPNQLSM